MSPIFEREGKWFFWDETWSYDYGPFDTEEEAKRNLKAYTRFLDIGE